MNTIANNSVVIEAQIQQLFSDFHPQSRVWIYQSYREMSDFEETSILAELKGFCNTWTAHQVALRADVSVFMHRFILLVVDEAISGASGCSIDKSVHAIQRIEQRFSLQLFDRLNLSLFAVGKCQTVKYSEVKHNLDQWQDTLLFDNSITTVQQLHSRWLIKVKESYLVR